MLPIFGRFRYGAFTVFLSCHCVNVAILTAAAVLYLQPLDAVRFSTLWIVASHTVVSLSLAMVAGQVFVFADRGGGAVGPWGARFQVLCVLVMLTAWLVYLGL